MTALTQITSTEIFTLITVLFKAAKFCLQTEKIIETIKK